jgi:hypothetical protein
VEGLRNSCAATSRLLPPFADQPGDLRLLRRELVPGLRGPPAGPFAGGQQLNAGPFGERLSAHRAEHVVRSALLLARHGGLSALGPVILRRDSRAEHPDLEHRRDQTAIGQGRTDRRLGRVGGTDSASRRVVGQVLLIPAIGRRRASGAAKSFRVPALALSSRVGKIM